MVGLKAGKGPGGKEKKEIFYVVKGGGESEALLYRLQKVEKGKAHPSIVCLGRPKLQLCPFCGREGA